MHIFVELFIVGVIILAQYQVFHMYTLIAVWIADIKHIAQFMLQFHKPQHKNWQN